MIFALNLLIIIKLQWLMIILKIFLHIIFHIGGIYASDRYFSQLNHDEGKFNKYWHNSMNVQIVISNTNIEQSVM